MEHEIMRADVHEKIQELRSGRSADEQRQLAVSLLQTILVQFSREWEALKGKREDEDWLLQADRLIDYYSHLLSDVANELYDLLPEEIRSHTWGISADMLKTANMLHLMGVNAESRDRADELAERAMQLSGMFETRRREEQAPAETG
ncbi:MAG: hypothetical protein QMD46_06445 [Methanomicrobiales archaeon]|nr:hypothetical protein [Methanomicrobiales archaeon]